MGNFCFKVFVPAGSIIFLDVGPKDSASQTRAASHHLEIRPNPWYPIHILDFQFQYFNYIDIHLYFHLNFI